MTQHPRAEIDQLAEASIAALRAPSILNTQPWRWRLEGEHAELWADRARRLDGLDPDGRLLLLSCGTALHHATVALRAAGYAADIERLPDAERPDLLARIRQGAPGPAERDLYAAIYRRRTDRRPFADRRPDGSVLAELGAAAERHGTHLHVVRPDQVAAFASAVAHANAVERADDRYRADILAWTTRPRQERDGVSARSTVPAGSQPVPPRDLNPAAPATLRPGPGADRGTVYLVLAVDAEAPAAWLAAGEALSDVWLTLTARGLAASPISEVVEVEPVRAALRRLLGGAGHPAIAVRVGYPEQDAGPVPVSTRRSGTDTVGLPGQP
ncbi:nitroreductase family protein [Dactylosporangium sp. AC04546]|uniref:Acg family FMN-binding oxidoreductase n=1 Tax=Dactylosporangium sp. AC04546 TaxID=2862460 RepID=UPI001EDD2B75|nr:nitroreductase family protein [Dactylosporangium sp. AC04546]WVK78534.1 nitroreductase family protein [Dactylosporangium sp. AC04546]